MAATAFVNDLDSIEGVMNYLFDWEREDARRVAELKSEAPERCPTRTLPGRDAATYMRMGGNHSCGLDGWSTSGASGTSRSCTTIAAQRSRKARPRITPTRAVNRRTSNGEPFCVLTSPLGRSYDVI